MLCGGKMLLVNVKAGSFNTHAVGQQLSRLFDPSSVAKLSSPEHGTAPSAPKRKELSDFLDQVLLRMNMGLDLEEFLRNKDCYELPAEEDAWLELPALCTSPPPTSDALMASADVDFPPEQPKPQHGTAATAEGGDADGQQQQQPQQSHVPKARNEFSASNVWAASQGLSSMSDAPRHAQGEEGETSIGGTAGSGQAGLQDKSRFHFAREEGDSGTGGNPGMEADGERVRLGSSARGGQDVGDGERVRLSSSARGGQGVGQTGGKPGDEGEHDEGSGEVARSGDQRREGQVMEGVGKEQDAKHIGPGGMLGPSSGGNAAPPEHKDGEGPAIPVARGEGREGGGGAKSKAAGEGTNGSLFFTGMGAGSGVDGIDGEGG
ncbi:hypothetical protein DUNSADRAFT_5990, partial [Dunaliella salina]